MYHIFSHIASMQNISAKVTKPSAVNCHGRCAIIWHQIPFTHDLTVGIFLASHYNKSVLFSQSGNIWLCQRHNHSSGLPTEPPSLFWFDQLKDELQKPELRTLSSLFCQLSSLFTIRSMQWESVAKIPTVVALNVMASPLKSIPLMPLWLKHWNTDGEREQIQSDSLKAP